MDQETRQTAEMGDIVVAVYDEAAHFGTTPREVSLLATEVVRHLMRHMQKTSAKMSPVIFLPALCQRAARPSFSSSRAVLVKR